MLIISTWLNHLPPKETQEIAQEELAQIAIDLIRAEAAADDQLNLPNYKYCQYIQATTSALTTIMGSVDPVSETSSKPLEYDNAREILHADAENEPSIEEILLKLKKDEDLTIKNFAIQILGKGRLSYWWTIGCFAWRKKTTSHQWTCHQHQLTEFFPKINTSAMPILFSGKNNHINIYNQFKYFYRHD